jgi:tRNA (adenine9-N1/guanine9-N1)-methyltransferase
VEKTSKNVANTRPYEALLKLMDAYGYNSIGSREWLELDKLSRLGFQYVATEALIREYSFIEDSFYYGKEIFSQEYKGKKKIILYSNGQEKADVVMSRKTNPSAKSLAWRALLDYLPQPPLPLFVIDMSMKFIHTPEELAKLRLQIGISLSILREFLWDAHLAITGIDEETGKWLLEVMGYNKASISNARPSEILWGFDADKVVILRPDAPNPLKPEDVLTADAFLIGGIVDRIPRPGLSRMLDSLVPWGIPRKIELKGSVIGVPERINRIIEMLLKARYTYGGDINKAIISTMTKKDRIARAYREIVKSAKEENENKYITKEDYNEIRSWLPISIDEFNEAAKRAHINIRG